METGGETRCPTCTGSTWTYNKCYRAGTPCPLNHDVPPELMARGSVCCTFYFPYLVSSSSADREVCKAEHCAMDEWREIIAALKAASPTGTVKAPRGTLGTPWMSKRVFSTLLQ